MAGLPEVVLRPPLLADGPDLLDRSARHAMELAREGFRVLAVARADRPAELAGTASGTAAAGDMGRDVALLAPVARPDPPRRTAELVREFGWDPVDIGGIDASHYLEATCMVWVCSAMRNNDWNRAFKLLPKEGS